MPYFCLMDENFDMLAKCLYGFEAVLAKEGIELPSVLHIHYQGGHLSLEFIYHKKPEQLAGIKQRLRQLQVQTDWLRDYSLCAQL